MFCRRKSWTPVWSVATPASFFSPLSVRDGPIVASAPYIGVPRYRTGLDGVRYISGDDEQDGQARQQRRLELATTKRRTTLIECLHHQKKDLYCLLNATACAETMLPDQPRCVVDTVKCFVQTD